MKFLGRIFKIIIYLLVLKSTYSFSQSSLDSVQQLSEVSIVAEKNKYKEVIPSQKLSGVQLNRLNSHSVADAIRYFSGVQIKDYGGIGGLKTVDIRSMGTNHMGVFYDGIQLGNAQNGQIDLDKFSLDNIEEISLYNGQKSEIFQPAKDFGSAGTIYLRTRKPTFKNGKKKTNIKALFRTGSFDLANPSILWEQRLTKNINSSLNAEYIYSSGKYKFRYRRLLSDGNVAWDTTAIRQNGDIHSFRLEGGINGYFHTGQWNIKSYFYDSEKGIPGAIVNNVWKHSQRQWDRNFFTQGTFQKEITRKYEILVNTKYANDCMRYLNPDTTLMYIDNNFMQQEIYASITNRYSMLSNWDIAISTDFQWNTLDANLKNFVHPKRHSTLVALATAFELWKFKTQASLLGTFVNEQIKNQISSSSKNPTKAAPNKTEYTPAIFISYSPFEKIDFNIRAFYKRIFRMPTFNDLYYTDIGNILLLPEYTTQYNLGIQYNYMLKKSILKNIKISTDAYYNEVTDKIIAVPKGTGQYRWMMMNIGYVEIRGIDAALLMNFEFLRKIFTEININYTYQKAQDFTDPVDNDPVAGTYGGQIAYIPWHSCSFILRANYKRCELNYSFIYVGERYHNSSNIRENYEQPWYTHDVSFGKDFRFKKSNFKISAEINNLLNQYYDVVLNYPMPGRNYKLIFKLDI
jgi:outer membrane cobalamin receptor